MAWCSHDGIRPILCQSLEALLQRDRLFAQAFVRDRRTFQRIVKSILPSRRQQLLQQELHGRKQSSRLERSAGLHCIVLAFRLARIDDFTAEMSLPILIAGALSGVVRYPAVPENEGQEESPETSRPSSAAAKDCHNNGCQQKRNTSLWPSTPLYSAQELAAHAVVNPIVGCSVHWLRCNAFGIYYPTRYT